ncbi:hypothetical protein T439DRAFT_319485 [Meredithblackwellia eburnea MCA 4105]
MLRPILPLLLLSISTIYSQAHAQQQQHAFDAFAPKSLVPVALGVMSKCPDAALCESVWDKVLDSVGGLVDLELIYIGKANKSAEYGVTCMHGDSECVGNIQQLCAYEQWRGVSGDVKPWADWWAFIQCLNYGSRSAIGDLETAKQCSKVVGHADWDKEVQPCVDSPHGRSLLLNSITRAQTLNITKSCTVIIDGKQVCIHDSTWKECPNGHEVADFAKQVRDEWDRLNRDDKMPGPGGSQAERPEKWFGLGKRWSKW